jgi:hypothetical protein
MRERNELEYQYRQFSDEAVSALCSGKVFAEPLINTLEQAYTVAKGIETVLNITVANLTLEEGQNDEGAQIPLERGTIDSLQRFASVSARMLALEVERIAAWADRR